VHGQQRHRRDDLREAARKVGALSREQPHPAVRALGQDTETVVLDLVNPAPASGRLLGRTGKARLDEGRGLG